MIWNISESIEELDSIFDNIGSNCGKYLNFCVQLVKNIFQYIVEMPWWYGYGTSQMWTIAPAQIWIYNNSSQ